MPQPREELSDRQIETRRLTAIVLACGLFALWAVAQWLYNEQFQQFAIFFHFSQNKQAWTLSLFNVAYFVLAIPAAIFHRKFGYKLGLLLSLSLFTIGAFLLYFAIIDNGAGYFLCAVLTMGSGWAWFETCLNPLVVEAGKAETAVWRLNMVQIFNAIGLLAGAYLAQKLAMSHYYLSVGSIAQTAAHPYVVVGLVTLLIAFFIEQLKLPVSAYVRVGGLKGIVPELCTLLRHRAVLMGAASLAAYCITLTVLWSATYEYRIQELNGREFDLFGLVFFWFLIGRLIGAPLMRWIDPVRLVACCAILSLAALGLAVCLGGMLGWIAILAVSGLLAITFPTVFAFTLARFGDQTKLVSGVLVAVAGFGSAVGPLFVTPSLHAWPIRYELVLAIPFVAVILTWSLIAGRIRQNA